jgi:hypothetical protein
MATSLDASQPSPAAYPLPSLLALVQPATHPELRAKLIALARRISDHQDFFPRHPKGSARAPAHWPIDVLGPRTLAKPILEDLGLPRPSFAPFAWTTRTARPTTRWSPFDFGPTGLRSGQA